jgi:hypothetical protein
MRSLLREWTNNYYKGLRTGDWTKRLRWYEPGNETESIRVQFEDADGKQNKFYPPPDKAQAEADWQAFKAGTLTTEMIRRKR